LEAKQENIFIDTDKRIIYIHDYIQQSTISKVCYNLLWLLDEDNTKESKERDFVRKPIKIYINSHGGYVDDMWALIDIMINSKTPIYTYSTGYADSCGFFIFLAGEKRFISAHTKMLCHQFSGGVYGEYQNMKEAMEEYDKLWIDFEKYVCSRTTITQERINDVRERKLDWIIYPEESIELGVATDIITEF
jgi:ATP-dependent Clp protease protease subunit